MPISKNLAAMIRSLPTANLKAYGGPVVPAFGIVIETHRDWRGPDQFLNDYRRGDCAPIQVALDPANLRLVSEIGDSVALSYHKHRFMTIEDWSRFVLDYVMATNESPVTNGTMPTSLIRDSRMNRNQLRSFRQMVVHNWKKNLAAGTLVKP